MRASLLAVGLALLGSLQIDFAAAQRESARLIKTIDAPKDYYPVRMFFMPDGKEIVTLYGVGEKGRGGKVELRSAASGEVRLTFDVDVESSFGLAVSPDGATIVTTNSRELPAELSGTGRPEINGQMDVWDATTGKLKVTLRQDGYWGFTSPFFYPDGKTLGVAESQRTDIPTQRYATRFSAWDLARGATKFTIAADRGAFHATVSSDCKLLATGESEMDFWNAGTGEHVKTWPKLSDEQLSLPNCFATSGKRLYSLVVPPPDVWLWDVAKGEVAEKAKLGSDESSLWHMVVAPSGKFLAVALNPRKKFDPEDPRAVKPEILFLDAEKLTTLETLTGHRGRIMTLAISPDSSTLASHGEDGMIRFWDVSNVIEK